MPALDALPVLPVLPSGPAAGDPGMHPGWFSKSLGDGLWVFSLTDQIRDAFEPLFARAGRPLNMAVLTRYESEGRLQCEVMAYFSPAAAPVAQAFNALPCEKPLRDSLDLLAGDARCWSVLFPDFE